jgi:hypothetical protein
MGSQICLTASGASVPDSVLCAQAVANVSGASIISFFIYFRPGFDYFELHFDIGQVLLDCEFRPALLGADQAARPKGSHYS